MYVYGLDVIIVYNMCIVSLFHFTRAASVQVSKFVFKHCLLLSLIYDLNLVLKPMVIILLLIIRQTLLVVYRNNTIFMDCFCYMLNIICINVL